MTLDGLIAQSESTDEPEIKQIIDKQIAKIFVNRVGVRRAMCSRKMLGRNTFKLVTKKIAPVTGFIMVLTLNLFFLAKTIQHEDNYTHYDSSIVEYVKGVFACLRSNLCLIFALAFLFNATCCLLCSLVCSAGTQRRRRID